MKLRTRISSYNLFSIPCWATNGLVWVAVLPIVISLSFVFLWNKIIYKAFNTFAFKLEMSVEHISFINDILSQSKRKITFFRTVLNVLLYGAVLGQMIQIFLQFSPLSSIPRSLTEKIHFHSKGLKKNGISRNEPSTLTILPLWNRIVPEAVSWKKTYLNNL